MVGLGEARANHSNRNLWKLLGPLKRSPAPMAAPDASPGSGVSFSVTASIDSLRQKLLWSLHNNKQQESCALIFYIIVNCVNLVWATKPQYCWIKMLWCYLFCLISFQMMFNNLDFKYFSPLSRLKLHIDWTKAGKYTKIDRMKCFHVVLMIPSIGISLRQELWVRRHKMADGGIYQDHSLAISTTRQS